MTKKNALFVLKIFLTFWSSREQLDWKDKVNFKIYDVTSWETKIRLILKAKFGDHPLVSSCLF